MSAERFTLLGELDERESLWIISNGIERIVEAGTLLVEEGHGIGSLYFVLGGLFGVKTASTGEVQIGTMGRGEVIGEISFLEGGDATATVHAVENSTVLEVPRTLIKDKIATDAAFAAQFFRALTRLAMRRLREQVVTRHSGRDATLKSSAGNIDDAVIEVRSAAERLARLQDSGCNDAEELYQRVVAGLAEVNVALRRAEIAGVESETLRDSAVAARGVQAQSPFVARLQTWPRGYPGDFETIEYLCDAEVKATPGTVACAIEQYVLNTATAQQHRNKVAWQGRMVLKAIEKPGAKVLSIACGGSRDIRSILDLLVDRQFSLVLNDIEVDALSLSRRSLESLGDRVQVVEGDVFRAIRKFRSLGPFDLIMAGGLFDYIPTGPLGWILARLANCLIAGGAICFTNIGLNNPDRVWLEHIADWSLLGRSREDIQRVISEAGLSDDTELDIASEPTGLTHLVTIRRR